MPSNKASPLSASSRFQALFLHANGFPTGTYRQFLEALGTHMTVHAPEIIVSQRSTPATRRWPEMTEQVVRQASALASAGPLVLTGHSMGGYLSLIAGARLGRQVAAVVLIDSPLVTSWRRPVFEAPKFTRLTSFGGPAPIAARRRDQWASAREAYDHLSPKAFTRDWAPGVLDDFIEHGLVSNESAGVSLRIAREIERDIYARLPAQRSLSSFKRLRALGVPVFMIAGKRSVETEMAGREGNRQLFQKRWLELPGGHLIPMELPVQCADAVARFVATVQPAA